MDELNEPRRAILDRTQLPETFPTHNQTPEFWEHLGRAVGSFGYLEMILGQAIFALTATRRYSSDEINEAYKKWLPKLERALSDQLVNLAEAFGKAARENPETSTENVPDLVDAIKNAAVIRNVLCHGSWSRNGADEATVPFFVNRKLEVFDTPVDVHYLKTVQAHVADLTCSVVDVITHMGWQFPGGAGPGKAII